MQLNLRLLHHLSNYSEEEKTLASRKGCLHDQLRRPVQERSLIGHTSTVGPKFSVSSKKERDAGLIMWTGLYS